MARRLSATQRRNRQLQQLNDETLQIHVSGHAGKMGGSDFTSPLYEGDVSLGVARGKANAV